MRVRVLLGTVRATDREYKVGEELELNEGEAQSMIREGVVEEVKEEKKPKAKPKAKPKTKPKKKTEEPKEAEENVPEPSMDWTRKELDDHARSKGIENPEEFETKAEVLKAIEEGGVEK